MDAKGNPPPYPGYQDTQPSGAPPGYGSQPQPNYGYAGQPPPQGYPQAPYYGQPQQQQQQQQQSNVVVTQAGGYGGPVYQTAPVDYTTQAFIACLCCFWPTGLVAIMKASESRDAVARGDYAGAHAAANTARQMVRISYIVGIIGIVFTAIIIGVYFAVFINAYSDNYYD